MAPIKGSAGAFVAPSKSSASSLRGIRPGTAGGARRPPDGGGGEHSLWVCPVLDLEGNLLFLCLLGIVK